MSPAPTSIFYQGDWRSPEAVERIRAYARDRQTVGNRGWMLKRRRVLAAQRERITHQLEVLHGDQQ